MPKARCGRRTCPLEDCGGVSGYYRLLELLKNPGSKEYGELANWIEAMAKGPFDPENFDPARVEFEDPKIRLQMAVLYRA